MVYGWGISVRGSLTAVAKAREQREAPARMLAKAKRDLPGEGARGHQSGRLQLSINSPKSCSSAENKIVKAKT